MPLSRQVLTLLGAAALLCGCSTLPDPPAAPPGADDPRPTADPGDFGYDGPPLPGGLDDGHQWAQFCPRPATPGQHSTDAEGRECAYAEIVVEVPR